MAVTLKTLMSTHCQAGGVFYPVDSDGDATGFNETIVFIPGGDPKQASDPIRAHVHQGALSGRNERAGEGWAKLDDRIGKVELETITVDIPAGLVTPQEAQDLKCPDMVRVVSTDRRYWVIRVEGRDENEISLICSSRKYDRSRGNIRG